MGSESGSYTTEAKVGSPYVSTASWPREVGLNSAFPARVTPRIKLGGAGKIRKDFMGVGQT